MLRAVATEIVHLFVDDGWLALGLLLWCAIVGIAFTRLPLLSAASGPALFIGCAAILVVNVIRTSRARNR